MHQIRMLSDQGSRVISTLAEALATSPGSEKLLFLGPHDDDANIGVGLLDVPDDHIHFLGFPDCALGQYTGRRPAQPGEPEIAGFPYKSMAWGFSRVRLKGCG